MSVRLDPPQRQIIRPSDRSEWLAARQQDVTASVAGCLAGHGIDPYITPYQLYQQKLGTAEPDKADNKVLRRGRKMEPVLFEILAEDYPTWVNPLPIAQPVFPRSGGSIRRDAGCVCLAPGPGRHGRHPGENRQ